MNATPPGGDGGASAPHDRMVLHLTRRRAVIVGAASLVALGAAAPPRNLFLLGDSWAAGLYADPDHALGQIAAARLGWGAVVDAVSGTGYVQGEDYGASYPDRLRARDRDRGPAIAVLQGGSNDRAAVADGFDRAVLETLALLRDRLPAARPVLLGPGPDPMPVDGEQVAVDRALQRVARSEHVPYVSMLQRHWIPARHAWTVLDPENHHPTVAGQEYLGQRLASALHHLYPHLTSRRAAALPLDAHRARR